MVGLGERQLVSPTGVGDGVRSNDPDAHGDCDRRSPRWGSEAAGPLPFALPEGADSGSEDDPRFFLFTAAACLSLFSTQSPS